MEDNLFDPCAEFIFILITQIAVQNCSHIPCDSWFKAAPLRQAISLQMQVVWTSKNPAVIVFTNYLNCFEHLVNTVILFFFQPQMDTSYPSICLTEEALVYLNICTAFTPRLMLTAMRLAWSAHHHRTSRFPRHVQLSRTLIIPLRTEARWQQKLPSDTSTAALCLRTMFFTTSLGTRRR